MHAITVTRYRTVESTTTLDVPKGFDPANEDHRDALIEALDVIEVEGDATVSYLTIEPARAGHRSQGYLEDGEILIDPAADDPATTWGTWTYIGHWDNNELVIDFTAEGDVVDYREDTGYWPEGLFSETVSAPTEEEGLQILIDRYVDNEE